MQRGKGKIVVVGMQRTGTTSLGEALLILGYSVAGTQKGLEKPLLDDNKQLVIKRAARYDALQDLPWLMLYKELDNEFPGSKFILTQRDVDSWIRSMLEHFGDHSTEMRRWAYGVGTPTGNEEMYKNVYAKHYSEICKYFENRRHDLLVMDLAAGDGWEKLCPFLNVPIPKKAFPHANKSISQFTIPDKIGFLIRKIIPPGFRIFIKKMLGLKDRRNRFHTLD